MNASISRRSAFTLIEIMVVVAIIGLIMAAGAPTLIRVLQKEGFRKTVSDIVDVCSTARARAIMSGDVAYVVFRPYDKTCTSEGGAAPGGLKQTAHTARIEDGTAMNLFVNLRERTDDEVVRVCFFPDGTCEEMLLILTPERGEQRGITLELTTGFVTVLNQADLQKMRDGRL
jgi:prepilin-type N-terminal cleavage/methylation domain-containing protein